MGRHQRRSRGAVTALRARWRRGITPREFEVLSRLALWALVFIIVSGAAVRLTGSGLGCSNWPTCSDGRIVAPWQFHAWVEFGNRLVTGVVSVAIVAAVLGSRLRTPRRRDLDLLAWGLVLGLVAEIVLGGETVKHGLAPQFVMSHFLLSLVLLSNALVLRERAGRADQRQPDTRPGWAVGAPVRATVSPEHVALSRLMVVAAGIVVFLGTIVTSTGPHGGDPRAKRFDFSLHDVAKLHASSVWLFLLLVVATLWSLSRSGAPRQVIQQGEVLLVVLVAQGALGYIQYFTGVPAALVELHVAGATAVWIATVRFGLKLFHPATAVQPSGDRPLVPAP